MAVLGRHHLRYHKIAEAVQREKGCNVEIFQMMEMKIFLINQAVWASKTKTKSLVEITNRVDNLESSIGTSLNKINELEEHATTTLHTDEILDDIRETLTWMEEYTATLESRMDTLTIGRLPHQFFPPAQLEQVLNEVMDKIETEIKLFCYLMPSQFQTYKETKSVVLWTGDGMVNEYSAEQQPYDESHARSYS